MSKSWAYDMVWRPIRVLHKGESKVKTARYMDDELVIQKGVEFLMQGLGPLETLRFLNLPSESRMESVKRHQEWQKRLDKKQFLDDVFSG